MAHSSSPPRAGSGSPGRGLSREEIIEAAIAMIDRDGVIALTMRSLGSALKVEAMSLYRYVNGREDLLEGVVEQLVGSIEVEPGARMEPNDGWQAFLQWFAHDVRRLALEHPNAFPLIATRHPSAPWLRPPLRSLRIVEAFLNGLRDRGFTDRQAVHAYRSFSSFLLGHLLLECAMSGAQTSFAEEPVDEGDANIPNEDGRLDLADYPTVARLQPQLTDDHTEAEFEEALEHLLVRMDLEMSQ
ncbi:MAG: TetR/AcrR family transcriptional regulator C-terminal domain-containing protein [Terracoccus sp.]